MTKTPTDRPMPMEATRNPATPLSLVLPIVFASSIGTGVVTLGLFFLTHQALAFSAQQNFFLGVLFGIGYLAAAVGAGPGLRWLKGRSRRVSTRLVLIVMLVLMALVCQLPLIARSFAGEPAWTVWVVVVVYAPLTGAHWPILESYISGGRRGRTLRSATGRFNITWAAATVAAMWAMAPLLERHALAIIALLGLVHLLSIVWVVRLAAEPCTHRPDPDNALVPHPPVYRQLLSVTRMLLPTSYLIIAAIAPYLPTTLDRLGVPRIAWHTPIVSSWLVVRMLGFVAMERWQGWHGRWWPVMAGGLGLLVGLALTVLAPTIAHGGLGVAVLILGLVILGASTALVYSSALYYAMEVGSARIDAGGTHEGLIGLGMAVGPACGLAATMVIPASPRHDSLVEIAVLVQVAVLAALVAVLAAIKARRLVGTDDPARA